MVTVNCDAFYGDLVSYNRLGLFFSDVFSFLIKITQSLGSFLWHLTVFPAIVNQHIKPGSFSHELHYRRVQIIKLQKTFRR